MTSGEWDNDEQKPAPLPAHERAWRHPSEIGREDWILSEPPVIIGRWLSATTGAVVAMIALAVLWTMVPTQAGRSAVVSVRSTLAPALDSVGQEVDGKSNDQSLTSGSTSISEIASSSTAASTLFPTTTAPEQDALEGNGSNTNTQLALQMATFNLYETATLKGGALAVAVSGGALVITTAFAVAADETVELHLSDGRTETARVLLVDQRHGLAVLSTTAPLTGTSFAVADLAPGDKLTLMGETTITLTVGENGSFSDAFPTDDQIREGTPVINQNFELVGLCTRGDSGPFIGLSNLGELRAVVASWSSTVRLGVTFAETSAALVVESVDAGGPADTAGLLAGDAIVSIESTPVADKAALMKALMAYHPGDAVKLSVQRGSGPTTTVVVHLAAAANSL